VGSSRREFVRTTSVAAAAIAGLAAVPTVARAVFIAAGTPTSRRALYRNTGFLVFLNESGQEIADSRHHHESAQHSLKLTSHMRDAT
jgi:hypothetical protein